MEKDNYDDAIMDFLSETLPYQDVKQINQTITEGKVYSERLKQLAEKAKSDKNVLQQILLRKDIKKAVCEFEEAESMRKAIDKIHKGRSIYMFTRGKWVAAASILLITISACIFYFTAHAKDTDSLFAEYYRPLKIENLYNTSESTSFNLAKQNYMKGNYHEAVLIFENLSTSINIEDEKELYTALAYIELENFEKAIDILSSMSEKYTEPSISTHTYWYLSLCYIKAGNIDKAVQILNVIVKNDFKYRSHAKGLIKDINKIF